MPSGIPTRSAGERAEEDRQVLRQGIIKHLLTVGVLF
jgi:hypothetical protein